MITDFYKTTKRDNSCEKVNNENVKTKSFAKQFYANCLNEVCMNEYSNIKTKLKSEMTEMLQKFENLQEAVKICSEIVEEKNIEIEHLSKQVADIVAITTATTVSAVPFASVVDSDPVTVEDSKLKSNEAIPFTAFEKDFKVDDLSYLRSVNSSHVYDSHFINTCMKSLYHDRLNVLRSRKAGQRKEAVTPQKHEILSGIYTERILTATKISENRVSRKKKLNKYIKNAIHNISKSNDTKDSEKEICRRIADNLNK